jgi:hypothetical protein
LSAASPRAFWLLRPQRDQNPTKPTKGNPLTDGCARQAAAGNVGAAARLWDGFAIRPTNFDTRESPRRASSRDVGRIDNPFYGEFASAGCPRAFPYRFGADDGNTGTRFSSLPPLLRRRKYAKYLWPLELCATWNSARGAFLRKFKALKHLILISSEKSESQILIFLGGLTPTPQLKSYSTKYYNR